MVYLGELFEPGSRVSERLLLVLLFSDALWRSCGISQELCLKIGQLLLSRHILFDGKIHFLGKLLGNFRSYFILYIFLDHRLKLFFQFLRRHNLRLQDFSYGISISRKNVLNLLLNLRVNSFVLLLSYIPNRTNLGLINIFLIYLLILLGRINLYIYLIIKV